MIGTRIGNWILETDIGTGSLGTVYRALPAEPKADDEFPVAALKVFAHPLTNDPAFQSRFPAEMLGLRRLTHPNIARFLESGIHAGLVYTVSEFVDGVDLEHRIEQSANGLNWAEEFFRIAIQAARALKHAHHRSILHREIKPSNFIVLPDGSLKVTDFGIAKILNRAPLTLAAEPMGAASYLAPELFIGKPLTRRSDLYSLGGVLYTVLTGRAPFSATTPAEMMHKHCYTLPDRPANFIPKLPHEIDDFVCSLLVKDPTRRPASAANLLEELDRIRGKLERKGIAILLPPSAEDPTGQHAPLKLTTATPSEEETRNSRENRRKALIFGTLFLIVVATILFAFLRPRPTAESLWQGAEPLLLSSDPDDWDRARDEYLDPLTRWHPDWNSDQVRDAKRYLAERKELNRSFRLLGSTRYSSEAERLYQRGLKLLQVLDFAEAQRTWNYVVSVFQQKPEEKRWVLLAQQGLDALSLQVPPRSSGDGPLQAIERTRKLRDTGHKVEADAMLNVIEELYPHRADVLDAVRKARTQSP